MVSRRSRWRPKESRLSVRSFVCSSVRSSVRSYVTQFLENHSLLFSENFQFGRTWIGDKMFQGYFRLFFGLVHRNCLIFLGSRRSRWRPKDSRPCVRPYVRTYVTLLLENRSLLFSETLQLVRACKCEKNVPSAFLKKFPFCRFWPKTVQNCPFWPKIPKNGGFPNLSRNPFL